MIVSDQLQTRLKPMSPAPLKIHLLLFAVLCAAHLLDACAVCNGTSQRTKLETRLFVNPNIFKQRSNGCVQSSTLQSFILFVVRYVMLTPTVFLMTGLLMQSIIALMNTARTSCWMRLIDYLLACNVIISFNLRFCCIVLHIN